MGDAVVTPEMRQAVRAEECALEGHRYDVIEGLGTGPRHVLCRNCGELWNVEPKAPKTVTPEECQKHTYLVDTTTKPVLAVCAYCGAAQAASSGTPA